ncbi:hypothetical protein YA0089_27940 [Pseudomonas viridiflava]|uniref:hypothetical protein n=1 Tax=Pseudomonas viridiflava TaxID=33069 RepID=UPI0018E64D90|nr:hypothetical protein [Pseudomonas viridiflava]MBI6727453.1 hypothetical protein [Pseudomonas viridiflava]
MSNDSNGNSPVVAKGDLVAQAGQTYSHVFSLCFSVGGSIDKEGQDLSPQQLHDAIVKRAALLLANDEIQEAVGLPQDSSVE